jgi:hypothetical protein
LQNFFAPGSEEHFSKTGPEWGILIQETCHLDSDIAHLGPIAHWPSFATQSIRQRTGVINAIRSVSVGQIG